jgi:hypothetical protein
MAILDQISEHAQRLLKELCFAYPHLNRQKERRPRVTAAWWLVENVAGSTKTAAIRGG